MILPERILHAEVRHLLGLRRHHPVRIIVQVGKECVGFVSLVDLRDDSGITILQISLIDAFTAYYIYIVRIIVFQQVKKFFFAVSYDGITRFIILIMREDYVCPVL